MTSSIRRTALTLTTLYAAFTVALWPEESYAQILRFGGLPSFLAALPYALTLGCAVTALQLGRSLRRATVAASVSLGTAIPFIVLGGIMARTPPVPLALAAALLFAMALVLASFGTFVALIPIDGTFQHLILWGGGAAFLILTVQSAPTTVPSEVVRASLVFGRIPPAFPLYLVAALAAGAAATAVELRLGRTP